MDELPSISQRRMCRKDCCMRCPRNAVLVKGDCSTVISRAHPNNVTIPGFQTLRGGTSVVILLTIELKNIRIRVDHDRYWSSVAASSTTPTASLAPVPVIYASAYHLRQKRLLLNARLRLTRPPASFQVAFGQGRRTINGFFGFQALSTAKLFTGLSGT